MCIGWRVDLDLQRKLRLVLFFTYALAGNECSLESLSKQIAQGYVQRQVCAWHNRHRPYRDMQQQW
jgi:hypothetical protein